MSILGDTQPPWVEQIWAVAQRYDREFSGQLPDLPAEVEAMDIFQQWQSGVLAQRIATPFWELAKPRKRQRCLDIGCGISFLIYPWREWDAAFYGQEVSAEAAKILTARGPQLNSKLFKGVVRGPAHQLEYETDQFDVVIATGVSCYYGLDYWELVLEQVRRVLKPEGVFVFDVLNGELPLAENWAILETYLGAEVDLEPLDRWAPLVKTTGGRVVSHRDYDLFRLYKVKWG